ncbi:hypothetical protein MUK42_17919 [Musa troglodytarum]|uniref:Uncharacterized protein n=1 Tax=Musa troglodytarum TaxID=320322 RepID=A0A9E7H9D7_9LILI|nr:hypothetical protein MUK42_17919 [Musa troglodytarum]
MILPLQALRYRRRLRRHFNIPPCPANGKRRISLTYHGGNSRLPDANEARS